MSAFKKAPQIGGPTRLHLLGRLRETQIMNTKPVLPAEILSLVLDHLAVADLLRYARVSKRMREMVYDDTRWVRRLQLICCWDEAAARLNAGEVRRKKLEAQSAVLEQDLRTEELRMDILQGGLDRTLPIPKSSAVPRDVEEPEGYHQESNGVPLASGLAEHDIFDFTNLSPITPDYPTNAPTLDSEGALEVISRALSVRGAARHEYGRLHMALNPYYKDALRSKHPSNAKIFRVYRDPNQQAQMLSQLVRFADADLSQGWLARIDKIRHMALAFEDAVAREFEQGLKLEDVDGRMRKYAHVLVTLNGGQRALDVFISTNPLIWNRASFGDPLDCVAPNNFDRIFLEESHTFFGRLSAASNFQVSIIDRVFPTSVNVIGPYLHMIGQKVVAPYLNTLFDHLHGNSMEAYVRAFSGTYVQCLRLAETMQPPQRSGDEYYDAMDQFVREIFGPSIGIYFREELAYFKRRSEIEVSNWEHQLSQQDASLESMYMTNVNRQADKRDFLTSFKKVVMIPVNVLPSFPMTSRFSGRPTIANARVNGDMLDVPQTTSIQDLTISDNPSPLNEPAVLISRTTTPLPEPPTTELAAKAAIMKSRLEGIRTLFSLEVALNLVHMAKGSIERTAAFARAGGHYGVEARSQCETIFVLLLRTLGDRHVRAGFDQAVEQLAKYNPRAASDQNQQGVTPLVIFLELVNVGDLIQQMLDVFYEQELVSAKLTDRNDFLNPTVKEKKRFEQMLDERVAAGLNKGIEVLMSEVEYICATTQTVEDFNPGATGVTMNKVLDISPSSTAMRVVKVVSAHTKMLVGSTDKNLLDVFNQEVGLRMFTALCKHLKRQRISVAGSVKLISDMNHYFVFIQSLRNRDLLQYFKALRELAQIYLIDPSDAKELATIIADNDRFLGIFRAEEVYEFAERRADWYQVKSRVEKAMYGIGCCLM